MVSRHHVHIREVDTLNSLTLGNGGLLTALAMIAAGTDETRKPNPGFPEDWTVKAEGLHKMP